jgi:hypothetical protein
MEIPLMVNRITPSASQISAFKKNNAWEILRCGIFFTCFATVLSYPEVMDQYFSILNIQPFFPGILFVNR